MTRRSPLTGDSPCSGVPRSTAQARRGGSASSSRSARPASWSGRSRASWSSSGRRSTALVFFVGSIFFTSAATLQYVEGGLFRPRGLDWWSNAVQLVGTVFFNVATFDALADGLDAKEYDRLVWTPDARGSICFLVSGCLACSPSREARRARATGGSPPSTSLGCVAFGISAVAAYVVPSTGSALDLAGANVFTSLGALCFLIGALLLLPEARSASPASDDAGHAARREPRVTRPRRRPR